MVTSYYKPLFFQPLPNIQIWVGNIYLATISCFWYLDLKLDITWPDLIDVRSSDQDITPNIKCDIRHNIMAWYPMFLDICPTLVYFCCAMSSLAPKLLISLKTSWSHSLDHKLDIYGVKLWNSQRHSTIQRVYFHKKFLVSMHWNFSKGGELCHCLIGDFFGGEGDFFFVDGKRRKHRQTKFWHILSKEETCGFCSSGFQRIIYFSS
jgi:hypothetical protein